MTGRWCGLAFVVLLLLGALPTLAAEDQAPPRFQPVHANAAEQLERRLQAFAAKGYRLMAVAQGDSVTGRPRWTALMEKPGGAAKPFGYRVVTCSGKLQEKETAGVLASLGDAGYHLTPTSVTVRELRDVWLPESAYDEQMTLVLEKGAEGRRYAFDSLAFGDYERFYRDLGQKTTDGYEVVGMWNTGRRLQVILQKRTDEGAPVGEPDSPEHLLLLMATRLVLAGKLESAAGDGFRILAADDPPTTGPPVILMEKTATSGNIIDYKFLDDVPVKQNKDKLEKKLNKKARKRWRVAGRGTTAEVIALERSSRRTGETSRANYLLVSSRRAPGLSQSLEDAMGRGYSFVRLFVEPDEATVLLERVAD